MVAIVLIVSKAIVVCPENKLIISNDGLKRELLLWLMCEPSPLQSSLYYWIKKKLLDMKPRWCKEHEDWALYLFSPESL